MDRRVVLGLVGFSLLGVAQGSRGQGVPRRDPSAQPSVGLDPIPSIADTINGGSGIPGAAPPPGSGVPTSPVGRGPDATIPNSPIPSEPVSLTPMEPIHRTLTQGYGSGNFSSLFRKPTYRPSAAASKLTPRTQAAPRVDPGAGRPAPYAGRVPETSRVQANPPADPASARPAPYAEERPRLARTQAQPTNPPDYRPVDLPAVEVLPRPTSDPNTAASEPPAMPPPPTFEPSAAPGPVGTDPLQGVEPTSLPALTPAPVPAPSPNPVDSEVNRTSRDEAALRTSPGQPRQLPYAARTAAAVGDEIITLNELSAAVTDQIRDMVSPQQQAQMSQEELYQLKNQAAASVLNRMIDQALVLQQANSKMKAQPKAKQMFDEFIDKQWKADEVPPLLKKTASANVYELKIKLASEGKSYETLKQAYRKKMMFNEFLRAEIHNKVTSDMAELRAYYNEHLNKFEQPARITWREVEINVARYPNRAAARQKAEEVLARLLRDENFDAVARATSNGPTASKGGLYPDMQPGSYGIPIVNDELNRLPTGQVSKILEAPSSFHIIRVDSRRDKGPLRFDEVQDKIRGQVLEQNFQRAVEEYLTKLRAKTLIRTMFDNTASDPDLARRNDPSVRQTGGVR